MTFENVEIIDAGAEGMAVGRAGGKVIFVAFAVPGDIVDIQVIRKKKNYLEGKILRIVQPSPKRVSPHCDHFGLCGGCRWQNMNYQEQLFYKQKQVAESLTRIGKLQDPVILPILEAPQTIYYRNKLDYTFSVHRWLTSADREAGETADTRAAGFHIPTFYDKVVDIRHCFHQKEPSNEIRLAVKEFAILHDLPFYDVRTWKGFLRNLIIRSTSGSDLMVILVFRNEDPSIQRLMEFLTGRFPQITSLWYVINPKQNDSLYDLEFIHAKGERWIVETLPPWKDGGRELSFRIGPLSFFQTNPYQAPRLYRTAADFAGLTGRETVYDLYTGTGTIACYIAPYAKQVVGIETVQAAVEDAGINAAINGLENTRFFAGEAEKVLSPAFIEEHGIADLVVTDPPRNGMHEKVVATLLGMEPRRIVYVSCNPATQARDIHLLSSKYRMEKSQPVDMFPHTQHVENVALLVREI